MDAGMKGGKGGKAFFHYPVDANFWQLLANIGNDGQVVQDVAERGCFDKQNIQRDRRIKCGTIMRGDDTRRTAFLNGLLA